MTEIKGAVQYQFEEGVDISALVGDITDELLEQHEFTPCGDYDLSKTGFTPFTDGSYVVNTGTSTAVKITNQTKKPHSAEVNRKCKIAEAKYVVDNDIEDGIIPKDIKDTIKLGIINSLLPSTPAGKEVSTILWITGDKVTVGCPSYNKGEQTISTLRFALESFPVKPVTFTKDVSDVFSSWVESGYEERLCLWNKVDLITEEGGLIKMSKESVYDMNTEAYTKTGAKVVNLQFEHNGATIFTSNTSLELSGIKINSDFLGGKKDEAGMLVSMYEIDCTFKELLKELS